MSNKNLQIFKTYDIRGVSGDEIDENIIYKIGKAFALFLKKENPVIVIGRDGRSYSFSFYKALKEGLLSSGVKVIDSGLSTTPLLNFAVAKFNYDGGVMVTASHNPPEFNGLKLIKGRALQVYGEEIEEIKDIFLKNDFQEKQGSVEERNFIHEYIEHILSFFKEHQKAKIVINCLNGMGALTAKPFFKETDVEVFFLFEEIDGFFPNHLPNPYEKKAIKTTQEKIKETNADFGVIFDGDADRCLFLDEKGSFVPIDLLFSFLAKKELKKYPKEDICYDLRFSMSVSEVIKKEGGVPVIMRVGNPFYKEKIIREGVLMGAELSGHIMFRENFGIDDALFVVVKTVLALGEKKEKMSTILSPFKKYFQTEEINLSVKNKEEVLKKVRGVFKDGEEIFLDGVYIRYPSWWFNLRKSNTEDLVRLRIEAKTKELLEEKKELIISLIKNST